MRKVVVSFLTCGLAFRGSYSETEGRKVRTGSLERGLRGKTFVNSYAFGMAVEFMRKPIFLTPKSFHFRMIDVSRLIVNIIFSSFD